jgi:hypothetical protein
MRTLHGLGILMLILVTARGGVLRAQTTLATVTGLVTDANGAAVPAVRIELTNTDTNLKYSCLSSENGHYAVPGMQNGPYTLRATAAGFSPFVMENIQLVERDMRRIDMSLQVGTVQTTVEVNSRVSPLNHPLWAAPDLNISNTATAGKITAVGGHGSDTLTTRQVQVLVRVEF